MAKCANEKCDKDPFDSPNYVWIGLDGDCVCDEACKREHDKQMAYFFDVIVQNEEMTEKYLRGEI